MATRCEEADELITALADDELAGSERASMEEHLRDCSRCQLAYAQEVALKREARMAGAELRAPAGLREKILRDPRIFRPGPAPSPETVWSASRFFRPALAFVLLIVLVLPLFYLIRPAEKPLSLTALDTHEKIVSGELPIIKAGSAEEIKERLVRSVAGDLAPMGYDLSMVNLRPVGGTVQEFNGRKVLVTLYEGKGPSLICYTFLGAEKDAPPEANLFYDADKNITFYTYSRGAIHAVLHREGKLICVLVSKLAMTDLLALARAKAQPTPS